MLSITFCLLYANKFTLYRIAFSELFNPLVNLELLLLDNNNLLTINIYAFRDTANLKFLDLENNQIDLAEAHAAILEPTPYSNSEFDANSPFQFLYKLQQLNLRNNFMLCGV